MFTRCPECRTVFHVSAAELRAAAGTVICGTCGVTFDALDSLSETRPGEVPGEEADAGETEHDATDDGEPLRDEDAFLEELESLISAESEEENWLPEDAPEEGSDEIPEQSHAEITPEPPIQALAPTSVPTRVEEDDFEIPGAEELPRDKEPAYGEEDLPENDFPDPDAVFRVEDFADDPDTDRGGPFVGDDEGLGEHEADEDASAAEAWRTPGEFAEHAPEREEDTATGEHIHELAREDEDGGQQPEAGDTLPEFAREPSGDGRGRRLWLPILLALVAVLFLTGTWAHSQRGKLMRHPAGEAILGPVYSLLGMDAAPEWDPAEFRALKWEAVADPEQPDRLIVAVEFVNDADYAQPYPIIRVALQDRFGRPAGRHDFAPGDYLESYSRGRRLPAAARLQTTVEVPDPEGRAEGFRIDFCLETRARGLVCGPELFR